MKQSRYLGQSGGRDFGAHTDSRSRTTLPTLPGHKTNQDQRSEKMAECVSTPSPGQQYEKKNDCVSTPTPNRKSEKEEDQTLTPLPVLPFDDDTMPYPYSKYWDKPDAEVHAYMLSYIHGKLTMSHNG